MVGSRRAVQAQRALLRRTLTRMWERGALSSEAGIGAEPAEPQGVDAFFGKWPGNEDRRRARGDARE